MTMTAAQKWTLPELKRLVLARRANHEGQGEGAFLDLHIKVTPEFMFLLLGGVFVKVDGTRLRFDGVTIDEHGYADPIIVTERR